MSERSLNQGGRPLGRPALPLDVQGLIFGRLAVHKKGSPGFRRTRRELAAACGRTERAIDYVFERRRAMFIAEVVGTPVVVPADASEGGAR